MAFNRRSIGGGSVTLKSNLFIAHIYMSNGPILDSVGHCVGHQKFFNAEGWEREKKLPPPHAS